MSYRGILCLLFLGYANSEGVSQECNNLRDAFADATSRFTSCAAFNSRPITMCEDCVDSYIDVVENYRNMTQFMENGTACIDNFINLDRLEIIETLYTQSKTLWHRAKCYMCFQKENGVVTPKRSNETLQFNTYYNRMMKCFNETRQKNDSLLCSHCLNHYLTLNDYYISISNENEKIGVCMDIVDMMNDTRILWSVRCCEYRKHPEYIFLTSTSLVLLIPVLFYILAQVCSKKKTASVLEQRRFAESLSQGDTRSDGDNGDSFPDKS